MEQNVVVAYTHLSPLMPIFVTLFEGRIGNCVVVDTTITSANVYPQGLKLLFFQMLII